MVNSCKYMGVKYTGGNITKYFYGPYIVKYFDEVNILADVMENILGLF